MVKQGYKQTEIGVIPEDWEVRELQQIGIFSKGRGISKSEANSGSIPAIRYGELYTKHHNIIKRIYSFIDKRVADNSIILKKGDILFAGSGETKEEIGKSAAFIDEFEAYVGGDIIILRPNSNISCSKYLGYLTNATFIQKQKSANGQGDAVVHIYSNNLKGIQIPLPPLREQEAIAEALSDADAWIESLEQLIAKKRLIKKGAMQELLTPKEDWEVKKLGEVIDVLTDYTANGSFGALKENVKYYSEKNYAALVRTTDLDKKHFEPERFTDKRGYDFLTKTALFGGELILANVGSIGKVFRVPKYNMPMTLAPNTYMIKLKINFSVDYIYQWMRTEEFVNKLLSKVGSSTLKSINKDNLRDIIFSLPKSLSEQERIATILSDMDAEIEALEQKLAKARQIKQGMMQELLTGRIRLV